MGDYAQTSQYIYFKLVDATSDGVAPELKVVDCPPSDTTIPPKSENYRIMCFLSK